MPTPPQPMTPHLEIHISADQISQAVGRIASDLAGALGGLGWEPTLEWLKVSATQGARLLPNRIIEIPVGLADRLADRRIVIVDDLLDSGQTLGAIQEALGRAGALEIKTATLLHKYRNVAPQPDFVGFDLALAPAKLSAPQF